MHRTVVEVYRCPYSGEQLRLEGAHASAEQITEGTLVSQNGLQFPIIDGVAHLTRPEKEFYSQEEAREKSYYEEIARGYDAVIDWLFRSFAEDERTIRATMVDLLRLAPGDRVLETGAGSCRDTVEIASRLGPNAELFVQDLSPNMLSIGRERMRDRGLLDGTHGRVEFMIGNAARLPFADDVLDAAYHFGGLNLFSDKKAALCEMARVVRPGGRVVVGDEGIAPWRRQSEYGAILVNSNKLYGYSAPLEDLPDNARDVAVRWLIGDAFYVIDLSVGEGPPKIDLDLPIQGKRGGTHRTRYYGGLEGVTVEAKMMANEAAAASGLTMHEWLDRAVRTAASKH